MNSLSVVTTKALPALSGDTLTFNPEKNVYLTLGYTSAAGNTYYKAIRFSNRLAIYYDLGQGYLYTFLNGITLFSWDGQKANIIARKYWDSSNWRIFSEYSAKQESIQMLKEYLQAQAKAMGQNISDNQLLEFSREMVEETTRKKLA